jgi:hypothetical protein
MAKQAKVWTGSEWADLASATTDLTPYSTTAQMNTAIGASAGLVPISTTTFTAQTQVDVTSVFSATYNNYKIIVNLTAATGTGNLQVRLLTGSTPLTTSNYHTATRGGTSTGLGYDIAQSGTSFWRYCDYLTGTNNAAADVTLINPFASTITTGLFTSQSQDATYLIGNAGMNMFNLTTSVDGIRFIAGSGSITGKVRIYGYKD